MPNIGSRIAQVHQSYDENLNVKSDHGKFKTLAEAQEKAKQVAASDSEDAAVLEDKEGYHVVGIDELGAQDAGGNTAGHYELHDLEAKVVSFAVTPRDQKGLRT